MIERRFTKATKVQLRAKKDGDSKPGIEGYSAVFNQIYDNGWFRETILPGAFKRALKEKQDVRCLFNHNPDHLLGRSKSGTLSMREDGTGLWFENDLPDTGIAEQVRSAIERGDLDGCSFAFIVREQVWREEQDPDNANRMITTREIHDLDLFDVGPVTYPAYDGTSVNSRSHAAVAQLFPDGVPAEVRSHVPGLRAQSDDNAADCNCGCRACYSGDCDECPINMVDCGDEENCRCMDGARSAARDDGKKTRRVDGEDLTSGAFLYVGDPDKPETWALPWKFKSDSKIKSHLRNALARFSQTKKIPSDSKDAVWKKLVAKCKKYGIKVTDDEAKSWGLDAEQRKQVGSGIDCQCDCAECQVGDCENCSDPDCDDPDCDHPGEDDRSRILAEADARLRMAGFPQAEN